MNRRGFFPARQGHFPQSYRRIAGKRLCNNRMARSCTAAFCTAPGGGCCSAYNAVWRKRDRPDARIACAYRRINRIRSGRGKSPFHGRQCGILQAKLRSISNLPPAKRPPESWHSPGASCCGGPILPWAFCPAGQAACRCGRQPHLLRPTKCSLEISASHPPLSAARM